MKSVRKKCNINTYKRQSEFFKALSHPTRLFIVNILSTNEDICVCELTDMVGVDISTMSRHLSVLKHSGIIKDKKVGNSVYYKLRCKCVLDFIKCVEGVIMDEYKEHIQNTKTRHTVTSIEKTNLFCKKEII